MSNQEAIKPPTQSANPTQLLERQTQLLSDLYEIQVQQQRQIEALVTQNRALAQGLQAMGGAGNRPAGVVKIADVNMPFMSLVGFIIKVALASIPAYIIMGILAGIVFLVLGGCTAGLAGLTQF